jgi:hypothetical protein
MLRRLSGPRFKPIAVQKIWWSQESKPRPLGLQSKVRSSPIFVTLLMEALHYSETSVLTRVTRYNIPEDVIFHSYLSENLKSYIKCPDVCLSEAM